MQDDRGMEEGAKKLVKSKSGLRMISVDKSETNPLYISEPLWTPDKQCTNCMECQAKFDFINRRHHCRRCGRCLCDGCCAQKLRLPRMRFVDPERQCGRCAPVTKDENDFFERHLKVLTSGAQILYNTQSEPFSEVGRGNFQLVFCRLSNDHSRIDFTSPLLSNSPEGMALSELVAFRSLSSGGNCLRDSEGNVLPTGVVLTHQNSRLERLCTSISADESGGSFKTGLLFVNALLKALRIIESEFRDPESFEEMKSK